ncbi:hypothetical protein [Streptomyces spirodelae]|uniref:HTH iclR-type domain-containing protein n=1 Tax=Streptomyces spirodelae TaxID=2812904 RepID=A0ABS3WSV5_9ACTN|nr:hypothetical protein [Streptomyces spirodelae]MBO8186199.1 hypothetical protein [Streptomyces spirodelae]
MSKRQKGRKHRRVNRTPRPVASATRARAARATGTPGDLPDAPAPRPAPAPETSHGTAPTQTPAPQANAPQAAAEAAGTRTPQAVGELFRTPVRDGGLGQSAGRTWERVREAGARGTTVEELAAAVGYQERTVLKHLQGLAEHGLAEQDGTDRWRPAPGALAATDESPVLEHA